MPAGDKEKGGDTGLEAPAAGVESGARIPF